MINEKIKDKLINLWIKAEDENRDENYNECLRLKDKWKKLFDKQNRETQKEVLDYLESIGG